MAAITTLKNSARFFPLTDRSRHNNPDPKPRHSDATATEALLKYASLGDSSGMLNATAAIAATEPASSPAAADPGSSPRTSLRFLKSVIAPNYNCPTPQKASPRRIPSATSVTYPIQLYLP